MQKWFQNRRNRKRREQQRLRKLALSIPRIDSFNRTTSRALHNFPMQKQTEVYNSGYTVNRKNENAIGFPAACSTPLRQGTSERRRTSILRNNRKHISDYGMKSNDSPVKYETTKLSIKSADLSIRELCNLDRTIRPLVICEDSLDDRK